MHITVIIVFGFWINLSYNVYKMIKRFKELNKPVQVQGRHTIHTLKLRSKNL